MWRSDWIENWYQIVQLLEHLTKNLGGMSLNPGLVWHYFSYRITGTYVFILDFS